MRARALVVIAALSTLSGCKAFGGVAMGLGRVAGAAAMGVAKAAPAIASGMARAAPVIARGAAQATVAVARAGATASRVMITAHPVDYQRPPGGSIYVEDDSYEPYPYEEPPTPWGPPPPTYTPAAGEDVCDRCPNWMECNDCLDAQGYACSLAPEGAPVRCQTLPAAAP